MQSFTELKPPSMSGFVWTLLTAGVGSSSRWRRQCRMFSHSPGLYPQGMTTKYVCRGCQRSPREQRGPGRGAQLCVDSLRDPSSDVDLPCPHLQRRKPGSRRVSSWPCPKYLSRDRARHSPRKSHCTAQVGGSSLA
jgi:hypothetical protein